MTTLRPREDPRTLKAIDIARTADSWRRLTTHDGELIVAIPSQSTRGLYYLVTEHTCTCIDHQRHGLRTGLIGNSGEHTVCKHRRALVLVALQQDAASANLVLERLPSGSYAWLRRP